MKNMLLVLWMLLSGSLHAAAIHLIILADTYSHTGEYARLELQHVQQEFAHIGELTQMEIRQQVFTGSNKREELWTAVQQWEPASDDCVVFYYIGHGYRVSHKKTPWPLLYFSHDQVNLDFQDIIDVVIGKKPRFALLIADCCNNVMDGLVTIGRTALSTRGNPSLGYRKLFEKSTGIVVVSASKPGDYAYCDDYGHCYSQMFWKVLRQEVTRDNPQWRHILDWTAYAVRSIQTPYDEFLSYP